MLATSLILNLHSTVVLYQNPLTEVLCLLTLTHCLQILLGWNVHYMIQKQ